MTDVAHDLPFVKMEGAGNDFVLVSWDSLGRTPDGALVRALCDRRRGVGGDGLLLVGPEESDGVRVAYWNRDGTPAFCGNGARCAAAFACFEKLPGEGTTTLLWESGPLTARVRRRAADRFDVDVQMPGPVDVPAPFTGASGERGHLVRVGVPHVVLSVERVEDVPLATLGLALRRDPALGEEGANVNVVEGRGRVLGLRTFERGVEGETLACGSGAVAAALVAGNVDEGTEIRVRSGDTLRVSREDERLWLSGPARIVFRGRYGG